MKKLLCLLAILLSVTLPALPKDKEETKMKYEITGNGIHQSSGTIVRITILTKDKNKVTSDDLAKAAVHGVLFRGYTDTSNSGFGSSSKRPPMMKTPLAETQHAEFFKPFFSDGVYSGYVQCMDDTRRVVKVGKEYKVSCDVLVSDGMLRKDLVDAGILKGVGVGL